MQVGFVFRKCVLSFRILHHGRSKFRHQSGGVARRELLWRIETGAAGALISLRRGGSADMVRSSTNHLGFPSEMWH